MRHAPYSTFSDSVSLIGPEAAPRTRRAAIVTAKIFRVLGWPGRVIASRRDLAMLGAMSEAQLKDIGLIRQDVVDAASLPLGREPGYLLTQRATENRRWAFRQRR